MKTTLVYLVALGGALSVWGGVSVSVTYHGPRTVHVRKTPKGATPGRSFAVKDVPPETAAADSLVVVERRADGTLFFKTRAGATLLAEKGPAAFAWHAPGTNAVGQVREARQAFAIPLGEELFGLGDLENGRLRVNGLDERLLPANVGDGIPYLVSEKGWALFWDNASSTRFTDVPGESTTFASPVAESVDYWFFYGGDADGCVAEMRKLTGDVPMLPLWSYGFCQSRERYTSQQEIVDVLRRYRKERIPIDVIIQDWQYWGDTEHWNSMEFLNPAFPEPKRMVDEIHAEHARVLISIWPSFGPKSRAYAEMDKRGFLLPWPVWTGLNHDAFNPEARALYYKLMDPLVEAGIDGWWMDATDLDFPNSVTFYNRGQETGDEAVYAAETAAGPFRAVRSAYSLATVEGVYDRTRSDPRRAGKRVFILTRGACAGQQRTGAAVWSGDLESNWDSLRRQIPAGCSFSLTGNPNFNCDIGGFGAVHFQLGKSAADAARNPHWQELYVRWMQLGTFLPMMRSHGTSIFREVYLAGRPGEPAYEALLRAIRLRYALMPYIYSTAWRCCDERYTMMRPFLMDFAADRKALRVTDEFMFGASLLVAPVVENAVTAREVYLPAGTDWWNFFTGERQRGGETVTALTTLQDVPVFVRAGSIVPIGPDVQYNGEKPWDNLEVRLYPGADGAFAFYEDDFETYACERGAYSKIRFAWNDATRTLSLAAREGEPYPGRIDRRSFRLVLPDGTRKDVVYTGEPLSVRFP
ncbi:MAG: DUF5110 domain-containing protein [Kiritimatiellae bacterium]|nr:DUF5110 domain-containing protein [Kiritimatiellia bacterium]